MRRRSGGDARMWMRHAAPPLRFMSAMFRSRSCCSSRSARGGFPARAAMSGHRQQRLVKPAGVHRLALYIDPVDAPVVAQRVELLGCKVRDLLLYKPDGLVLRVNVVERQLLQHGALEFEPRLHAVGQLPASSRRSISRSAGQNPRTTWPSNVLRQREGQHPDIFLPHKKALIRYAALRRRSGNRSAATARRRLS